MLKTTAQGFSLHLGYSRRHLGQERSAHHSSPATRKGFVIYTPEILLLPSLLPTLKKVHQSTPPSISLSPLYFHSVEGDGLVCKSLVLFG